jgi:hypothetical protein
MPDTTSNNETANTVFCVLAIGTPVLLLRPNRTTYNSRERIATQKEPKPTFAQGVAPWPPSPVSLNPQNKDNYSRLITVWMPNFRDLAGSGKRTVACTTTIGWAVDLGIMWRYLTASEERDG